MSKNRIYRRSPVVALLLTLICGRSLAAPERAGDAAQPVPATTDQPGGPSGLTSVASPATVPFDVSPLPDVPLPEGFSELGTTPSGRSVFSNFSKVQSVDDLIQHVGDALAIMFGSKPQFGSACVDAKNKNGGIATFSATVQGTPVKGVVLFGVNPEGTSSATVIYTRPNISKEEFATLMQTVPAQPKMRTAQAPDGSGSIDIPDGWTLLSRSLTEGIIGVIGPRNRALMIINARIPMDTPDGFRVRVLTNAYNSDVNLRRTARVSGPPPLSLEARLRSLNVSPYVGPEEVFAKIIPSVQEKQRHAGRTWDEFGDILFKTKLPSANNNTEAEVIGTTAKIHNGDKTTMSRVIIMVQTSKPIPTGQWTVREDLYFASEATAARDFPLMLEMYNSINIPQAAVQRQLDKDNKAFQAVSAYFQAQNDALLAHGRQFQQNEREHFQRFELQQAAQAQARHDACSNMIESSLGVRDVLDTASGQMRKVDLYNSAAITDTLNGLANDPNRFVQIPLRYER